VLGFEQEIQTAELDYQLVRQATEWRAPARYDQVLEISVSTQHLGTTSFTLATEFRIAGEEALIARSETVYVHVDTHTLTKAPLPSRLRAALERGAAGKHVDHAAYLSG
jgi:acyl-CoA thioester hydrolase